MEKREGLRTRRRGFDPSICREETFNNDYKTNKTKEEESGRKLGMTTPQSHRTQLRVDLLGCFRKWGREGPSGGDSDIGLPNRLSVRFIPV